MSFASVEIMAHFVAKSRDNPPNNLHSVWDEKEATKNPKRKRHTGLSDQSDNRKVIGP